MDQKQDKKHEKDQMDKHTDAFLIVGGDFNACMVADSDSLFRNKPNSESHLTDFIITNNETCNIVDAYRSKFPLGG